MAALLIIFGGLPGTGKTTIARERARETGATYLRIDSIEQAIRESPGVSQPINEEGYRVGYAVAEDNLQLGRIVISDSVNPIQLSRDAWLDVARRAHAGAAEIEITCSDAQYHRQRVESRTPDIAGLKLPTWEKVIAREYEPWSREHIILDTAGRDVAECVRDLRLALKI